jgi:hypothetical protein
MNHYKQNAPCCPGASRGGCLDVLAPHCPRCSPEGGNGVVLGFLGSGNRCLPVAARPMDKLSWGAKRLSLNAELAPVHALCICTAFRYTGVAGGGASIDAQTHTLICPKPSASTQHHENAHGTPVLQVHRGKSGTLGGSRRPATAPGHPLLHSTP